MSTLKLKRETLTMLACGAMLTATAAGSAQTVWGSVWKDAFGGQDAQSVQRFSGFGDPELDLGNGFNTFGFFSNYAVDRDRVYSGVGLDLHSWDAVTGADLGPFSVDSPLSEHLESYIQGIGKASNGDLLIGAAGFGTDQRTLARYTVDGTWVRDYSTTNLMHMHGTAVGTDDAIFVANRFNDGSWKERVFMFTDGGSFVGSFGDEIPSQVADVDVMGDRVYAMNFTDGVYVYDLNGASLPTFSHLIPFPPGVNPDAFALDQLDAHGNNLYIGDSIDEVWYRIDLDGNVLGTYEPDVPGFAILGNFLGPIVVIGLEVSASGDCPGQITLTAEQARPGDQVYFIYGFNAGSGPPVPGCSGLNAGILSPTVAGSVFADANGRAAFTGNAPAIACGSVLVQAVNVDECETSNVLTLE